MSRRFRPSSRAASRSTARAGATRSSTTTSTSRPSTTSGRSRRGGRRARPRRIAGRRPRAPRGAPRGDRRANAPRAHQPRALPLERHVRREAGHRSRARGGRDGPPRLLPVRGDGAARAQGVGLRHGVRRLGEVGLRRPGSGVPRTSRPDVLPELRADVHRVVLARRAVRVRHGADAIRERRVAHDRRDDAGPRGVHRARRLGDSSRSSG